MQEIHATECAGHEGEDGVPRPLNLHLRTASSVREDITLSKLNQSQLDVVAVGKEI